MKFNRNSNSFLYEAQKPWLPMRHSTAYFHCVHLTVHYYQLWRWSDAERQLTSTSTAGQALKNKHIWNNCIQRHIPKCDVKQMFQAPFFNSLSIRKNCWCEELHAHSHSHSCCEHLVSAKKAAAWIHQHTKTCAHRLKHTCMHTMTTTLHLRLTHLYLLQHFPLEGL